MIEVRFHGRGGQGVVVASNILASAFFREEAWVQSFPSFGGERRGAPVTAFVRANDQEIALRSFIYRPDHVVVLDPALVKTIDITAGLKGGGWIVINSPRPPDRFPFSDRFPVAAVDANRIAVRHRLGSSTYPIVNTVILGALVRATQLVQIDSVIEAIGEIISIHPERNVLGTREAYQEVRLFTNQTEKL